MKETLTVKFLYRTIPGRLLLKLLVQPAVSKAAGCYLSSGASKWLVPYYIWRHKIDMRDIDVPSGGFSSFNDFFTRKRKRNCFDITDGHLISPCDGFLSLVRIRKNAVFYLKNVCYTLEDLLKDRELAGKFRGGTALIFRLTPADYHRYCHVASGKILLHRKIPGKLHCVRPIALRTVPVFARNSREYHILQTGSFGTIVQMEIGALLVGKIKNENSLWESAYVLRGEEKGYFEFGGSTIVILLQKNTVSLNENLCKKQNNDGEIPVHMGEYVAKAINI